MSDIESKIMNHLSSFPVENMLVISTAHITKEVSQSLDREEIKGVAVINTKTGHLINSLKIREEFGDVPECLQICINVARLAGCRWLMLDRDADKIDVIPVYHW